MLELVGKLDEEARQVFFAALSDSLRAGSPAVSVDALAAGLLRVPSLQRLLSPSSVAHLLATLQAPPLGASALDVMRAFHARPEADRDAASPFPPVAMGTLPLDDEGRTAWLALQSRFADVGEGTVRSAQVLAVVVETSPRLTSLFADQGVTPAGLQ